MAYQLIVGIILVVLGLASGLLAGIVFIASAWGQNNDAPFFALSGACLLFLLGGTWVLGTL